MSIYNTAADTMSQPAAAKNRNPQSRLPTTTEAAAGCHATAIAASVAHKRRATAPVLQKRTHKSMRSSWETHLQSIASPAQVINGCAAVLGTDCDVERVGACGNATGMAAVRVRTAELPDAFPRTQVPKAHDAIKPGSQNAVERCV